jgi:exopolysaccharide biosynthesis polyprenyl glycosylphosphotransferase
VAAPNEYAGIEDEGVESRQIVDETVQLGADGSAGLVAPAIVPNAADRAMRALDERTLELVHERSGRHRSGRRGWLVRRMLLAADLLGLTAAFVIAQLVFGPEEQVGVVGPLTEAILFLATLPFWVVFAKLYHLYDRDEQRTDHTTSDDVVGVLHLITMGSWLLFTTAWLTGIAHPEFPKLLTFWALACFLVIAGRATARAYCRGRRSYLQNTVIVGAGDVGQLVARKLLQHPEYGLNLMGLIDAEPKERRGDLEHLTLLGDIQDLLEIVDALDVERVIVAFSGESHEDLLDLIRQLNERWIQVDIVPRLFEVVGPGVGIHTVEGLPLVGLPPFRLTQSSRLIKRTFDLVGSLLGLILLSPVFLVVAILIKRDSPGPVFFRQLRMGAGNQQFQIYKFRTMVDDADDRKSDVEHLNRHARSGRDPRMFKIEDDPRVTRVGRFLRRYLLDELPQLINVLKGEMSLVGPRPLILAEDQYVGGWGRRRLDLKPGMTGLWQVLGRSDIPFEEMVKLDYLYVTSWSAWNDLCLLFRTLPLIPNRYGKSY